VYSVNELCEVLLKQQKLDEMYAYLQLIDSLPELRAIKFPSYRFYHHLAQYHIRKGNNQLAVLYVDSFLQKYEVLRKEDRDLFRTDLDRSMRILESEYQLKQAQQAANLTQQRSIYVLLLLVGLVLLSALLWYAWLVSRRSNQALTQLNREKDKMLRVVAHDLRNPIAAIYSLSELNMPANASGPQTEDWRLVRQACAGALDLIQEMLVATEMRELQQDEKLEQVSINQLCSDTARLIQYRADEKQIELKFLPLPKEIMVEVAPERMRRAITNLLTNAIKFSTSGSTVTLQVEQNEKGVLISVQDQGIGIPESYQDKIFQSFTSLKRNGTKGELAYGLGLSIVKEIIEAQHGQIWYISTEGKGSTFYIQLPVTAIS
jgi:signal transduction histidine kinase